VLAVPSVGTQYPSEKLSLLVVDKVTSTLLPGLDHDGRHPTTSKPNNSHHAMYPVYPLCWRSYGHPFGLYPRRAGGNPLFRLRDRGREARVGFPSGSRPNPLPTNGRRDGICCYRQQLCLNESIHNACIYNSLSCYNLICFIVSVLSM